MTTAETAGETPEDASAPPRRASLILLILSLVAGLINYASNLVFGRMLSPPEFGDLTALLAIAVIAVIPAGAAQTRIAERLTTHRTRGHVDTAAYLIRHGFAHVGIYAFGIALVALIASPLIESALSLSAIGPALALSPLLFVSLLTPLALGVVQGLERFVTLGLFFVFIALSRLIVGTIWVAAGGGSGGAVIGQALGTGVALIAIALLVRPASASAGQGAATAGFKRVPDGSALAATSAFVAFALLSNLNIVLAKIALPPQMSGEYAALATLGKIVLFLPSAIAVAMVPRAARRRAQGGSAAPELRIAALVTLAISAVAAAAAVVAPTTLLRLMFGDAYAAAGAGVLPIVLAGTGLALLYVLVVYSVAVQDRRWSILLLGGVALQVPVLLLCDTPTQLATAQAAVVWLTLLINELFFHPLLRAEQLATGRAPDVSGPLTAPSHPQSR